MGGSAAGHPPGGPQPGQPDQRAKVVVRHLPPALSEEGFRSMIPNWLPRADYFYYVPGKQRWVRACEQSRMAGVWAAGCRPRLSGQQAAARGWLLSLPRGRGVMPAPCPSTALGHCQRSPHHKVSGAPAQKSEGTSTSSFNSPCSLKELVHSRAYLRFSDPADVLRFTHQMDGHAFLTERGTQYRRVSACCAATLCNSAWHAVQASQHPLCGHVLQQSVHAVLVGL